MAELGLPAPQEIATIAGFVAALPDGRWRMDLRVEDGSPWLLADLERVDSHYVEELHELHLALWRFSGAVFPVGDDGAVGEDSITPEAIASLS